MPQRERIDDLPVSRTRIEQEAIGQSPAALRFFNHRDRSDMGILREISHSPETRQWIEMEKLPDATLLRYARLGRSARGQKKDLLFAVSESVRDQQRQDPGHITGFIHFLCEAEQRRMRHELYYRGFFPESCFIAPFYEVFYARHPAAPDHRMRRALSHACMEVGARKGRHAVIIAQIEPENTKSLQVINRVGFVYLGETYSHEQDGSGKWYFVYQLDWDLLDARIRKDCGLFSSDYFFPPATRLYR